MASVTKLIIILLFASCHLSDSSKKGDKLITDSPILKRSPNSFQPIQQLLNKKEEKIDTVLLMNVSEEVLKYFKTRNYKKIALLIYPKDGLRFSPYAHIDTTKDRVLSAAQLLQLAKQNNRINWNSSWDGEKPDILTIDEYFTKFVYDVDFLKAELKSINEYHSQGTDLNNINETYPGCVVVEFYFSGFEKKYEGLDFRALRLVYKTENNKPYLLGIVHDQWTP